MGLAVIFPFFSLLDGQNITSLVKHPTPLSEKTIDDYTILVPIYNDQKYFKNKDFCEKHKKNILLCLVINNTKMENFSKQMTKEGFQVFEIKENERFSPFKVLKTTLNGQITLWKKGLPVINTKYVVFMDGDSYTDEDIGRACATLEENKFDVASTIIIPSKRETLVEKMQGVEYDVSMLGRIYRPWLTSGACIIGKKECLMNIMARHTENFYGGDMEIGTIGKIILGLNVGHVNLHVHTEVPSTITSWFNQRKKWWAGSFRGTIVNADTSTVSYTHLTLPTILR